MILSQLTIDLMLLLADAVDPEELKALVDSAFNDGLKSLEEINDLL